MKWDPSQTRKILKAVLKPEVLTVFKLHKTMHYKNDKNYDRVSLEVHVWVARLRLQLKM